MATAPTEIPLYETITELGTTPTLPNFLYSYRHELGDLILKNNLSIDIYGKCIHNLKKKYSEKQNIKYTFSWGRCI